MESFEGIYDVVVVGGGHGGCEAALASARMGARTLLLNLHLENAALMACNPSMGGPAKGHLIREVDALGGFQARVTDRTTLQLRWLNTSKGPAVRTLRAQCDLVQYHLAFRMLLETTQNLEVPQGEVTDLWVEQGRIRGVRTALGDPIEARRVVLAAGTYLAGVAHIGLHRFASGPLGELPASRLSDSLRREGFRVERLKTGTTPRLHADTVDWASLPLQESDPEPGAFSHFSPKRTYQGYPCAQIRTNRRTHDLIRAHLDRSPLFTGVIQGVGPRYCPSIEDKVVRFPERDSHPVFLEPLSATNREIYVQNLSTSLPYDVQVALVRTLPGCERAKVLKPGYAIEYDDLPPTQLEPWLETKGVKGLFCAGQTNGTSGYEEAASQGLLAGINAVRTLRGEDPVVLGRHEAYLGVLVDDLVTKGTQEPYRMLTSRCEHRLLLRHDNADRRLAPLGRRLGLLEDRDWALLTERWRRQDDLEERLQALRVVPTDRVRSLLASWDTPAPEEPLTAKELLRRPQITWDRLAELCGLEGEDREAGEYVAVETKYQGYVERQERQVARMRRFDEVPLPEGFDFRSVPGLLTESLTKLERVRPRTLGQAGRISGVTPADLQLLWATLEVRRRRDSRG